MEILPTPLRCPSTHEGRHCRKDIGHYPADLHADGELAWSDAPMPAELREFGKKLEQEDLTETLGRLMRRFEGEAVQERSAEPTVMHLRAHAKSVRSFCGDYAGPWDIANRGIRALRRVSCIGCRWNFAWAQVARAVEQKRSEEVARAAQMREELAMHWNFAAAGVVGLRHLLQLCALERAKPQSRFSLLETD